MAYATQAIVDLAAIRGNLDGLRVRVGDRRVLMAIKANAYGHGAVPVAVSVQQHGSADAFGVATLEEGAELRDAGICLPILKFSPCLPTDLDAAVAADLTLTVIDDATIEQAARAATAARRRTNVHLKVDTAMHRIGCPPSDAVRLAMLVDRAASLDLEGIFTHLPASDVAGERSATERELALFGEVVETVTAARGAVPLVHAANSGAVLQHDLTGHTMVRPGIAVYGYLPDATTDPTVSVTPAMRVVTQVTQVKQVSAGETVSYGRTWAAPTDRWIATVPMGYADGFPRLMSNAGQMLVGGRPVPVAGRVCMDQTMLDLGPVDGPCNVAVGDEVVAMGRQGEAQITADDWARVAQTISYEIVCGISGRVKRTHVHD